MPDIPVSRLPRRSAAGGLPLQVAQEIARRILAGHYPPGETIPVECALAEEFGVSRSVLREAVKLLSAKGLLLTRPKLGTFVRPVAEWSHLDPDLLAWRAELGVEEDFEQHLAEVRLLFESEAAALAAERATPEQRQSILKALEAMEEASDLESQVTSDLHFHRCVLDATGNPLLLALGGAVSGALAQSFAASSHMNHIWKEALKRHRRLAEAIAAGDRTEARLAMLDIIIRHAKEAVAAVASPREGGKAR